jgi:hypothetical protein
MKRLLPILSVITWAIASHPRNPVDSGSKLSPCLTLAQLNSVRVAVTNRLLSPSYPPAMNMTASFIMIASCLRRVTFSLAHHSLVRCRMVLVKGKQRSMISSDPKATYLHQQSDHYCCPSSKDK